MRHPIGTSVEFRCPRPVASSKNRRRLFGRGRSKKSLPSKQCVDDIGLLRMIGIRAARGLEFHADDALALHVVHEIATDELVISVTKVGELPGKGAKAKRGTRRDVHGMIETVADALQGALYPDDRAMDSATARRLR